MGEAKPPAPKQLCPYCGGPVTENDICTECGSHANPDYQIFDPIERAWQQGRFLRRVKFGKVLAIVFLLFILYAVANGLINVVKETFG
ncbi:MAG: hypothetical protein AB1327_07980 [Bacillota bacterium]